MFDTLLVPPPFIETLHVGQPDLKPSNAEEGVGGFDILSPSDMSQAFQRPTIVKELVWVRVCVLVCVCGFMCVCHVPAFAFGAAIGVAAVAVGEEPASQPLVVAFGAPRSLAARPKMHLRAEVHER